MRRLLLLVLLVPTLAAAPAGAGCASPAPLAFRDPVYIDTERSGGEPVSVVADDGSIIVAAHRGTTLLGLDRPPEPGFYASYQNQSLLWRSTDAGATWKRIEVLPGVSAHSATSLGFSDPDLAKDSAGNLYGTEIDLVNVSLFSSQDDGETWPFANPVASAGDRPWVAARDAGEVYLFVANAPYLLQKSLDGGLTWQDRTPPNAGGRIWTDPSDPLGLYAPTRDDAGVEVSRDDGHTWRSYRVPDAVRRDRPFSSIGVDAGGTVHTGWAQDGQILFASWDPRTGVWTTPTTVAATQGRAFWTWTDAGDAGRAAVAWATYNEGTVRVHVAVTTDGGCTFSVADAAGRHVYEGPQPCIGTGCNLTGDRRLGDFFTVNHDASGRVFVATGDTMLCPDCQTSRPLFIGATDASPRLTASG